MVAGKSSKKFTQTDHTVLTSVTVKACTNNTILMTVTKDDNKAKQGQKQNMTSRQVLQTRI